MESPPTPLNREFWIYAGIVLLGLAWSAVKAHYPGMWALEILPVLLGLGIVFRLRHRCPLSPVLQRLLTLLALLHLIGAHYSFSEVPAGFWLQEKLMLQRNPFDRVAHFAQGFVSAMAFRELFVRALNLVTGKTVFALAATCALAFSAAYELLEFAAWKLILLRHTQANVLGAQGDIWDTQWDMSLALTGALVALVVLNKRHDASMDRAGRPPGADKSRNISDNGI